MRNRLHYGDNLDVLRESVTDESVDLIYLDPPFNSQATYDVLFRSPTGEQSESSSKRSKTRGIGPMRRKWPSIR
jgi:site-specific DNA-methyltransferase (adenine-specific)